MLANNKYGLDTKINAFRIIENTLNLRNQKVYKDSYNEDGEKIRVLDKQRTAIAQSKQDEIKMKFDEWVFKDPQRREELVRIYNDKFQSTLEQSYYIKLV